MLIRIMGFDIEQQHGECVVCGTESDELTFGACIDCIVSCGIYYNSGVMLSLDRNIMWIPAHVKELQKIVEKAYEKE